MIAGQRVRRPAAPGAARCWPACCRACTRRCSRSPTTTRTPGARSTSAPPPRRRWPRCSPTCCGFDGALGARSEVVDGRYTGRPGGPVHLPRGQGRGACASWPRAEGIDLAASYAYSDSESDLPMLRAVGHPVGGQPRRRAAPRRARGGLGVMRFEQLGRRLKVGRRRSSFAALVGTGARDRGGAQAMSLHELTDEQREIRDLARRFADEEIAPHAGGVGSRAHASRKDVFDAARRARADGRVRARGARRRRRRLPLLRARARGALARRRRAWA